MGSIGWRNQEFVLRQLDLWEVIRTYMASKAIGLDEAPWGVSEDKGERSSLTTESWDTPTLRGQEEEDDTRKTEEDEWGRWVSWKPSEESVSAKRAIKWVTIPDLAPLWPWQRAILMGWWGWSPNCNELKREAGEGLQVRVGGPFREVCCGREQRNEWELEKDVESGIKGELLLSLVSIRDISACFKLFLLLLCEKLLSFKRNCLYNIVC